MDSVGHNALALSLDKGTTVLGRPVAEVYRSLRRSQILVPRMANLFSLEASCEPRVSVVVVGSIKIYAAQAIHHR